jgi:hypothetical protein
MPVVKTIKKLADVIPLEHTIETSLPEQIHLGNLRKCPAPQLTSGKRSCCVDSGVHYGSHLPIALMYDSLSAWQRVTCRRTIKVRSDLIYEPHRSMTRLFLMTLQVLDWQQLPRSERVRHDRLHASQQVRQTDRCWSTAEGRASRRENVGHIEQRAYRLAVLQ